MIFLKMRYYRGGTKALFDSKDRKIKGLGKA
jgi:hypothetical protein